jgi:hypothetical protein
MPAAPPCCGFPPPRGEGAAPGSDPRSPMPYYHARQSVVRRYRYGEVQEPAPEETPAREAGHGMLAGRAGRRELRSSPQPERSEIASLAASARWKKSAH